VARTGNRASATTQAEAAAAADIVLLAVPGMLVEGITKSLGDLSGKIIIDPTNPLVFEDDRVRHAAETSNSEIIQNVAPSAAVVKAFSTLNWRFMVDPDDSGGPVSIPLAGDSAEAKATVADIVSSMGLEPIDVGVLEHARWIEGMAILLINNFRSEEFNFHLRKLE
jgi:predicted dinucleotide-binding enzyme